jgi:prepilin-type processing-associated H-X9-DG protein
VRHDGGGTILHFDGTAWSKRDSETDRTLSSVWVAPSGQVFVAGSGVVLWGVPEPAT